MGNNTIGKAIKVILPDMSERPQKIIPGGFDEYRNDMTVCTDWPKTRNGKPPSAQSAIFNPLLACAITGPIDGYCNAEELSIAMKWWSRAFPAWSRWVSEIRNAINNNDNNNA